MSDRLTLSRAIEDAGIERAKAERVAGAIVDLIHDEVATRADVAAASAGLRADMMSTRSALTADIAAVRKLRDAAPVRRQPTRASEHDQPSFHDRASCFLRQNWRAIGTVSPSIRSLR
jgi:hypothetical protein